MTEVGQRDNGARPFRLGVNYWPARHAMSFWRYWDEVSVAADFARIQDLGLDSVRLFLTWEDFQPSPDVVDVRMLQLLRKTLDLAASLDLMVMPTLFTGHMSGANWFPGWAVRRTTTAQRFPCVCGGQVVPAEPINWYTDRELRAAQIRLASDCAAALAGHSALLAWDLGNENSNCVVPDSRDSARDWLLAMTDAMRSQDSDTPITVGLHMEDLEENRRLLPSDAARVCDFLTMHGYPGYASFTNGPTDERLLPFLAQLTRFLGDGKEVLFSEFGVPTRAHAVSSRDVTPPSGAVGPTLISESGAASYVRRSLRALEQSGATGAMLWCYSDYRAALSSEPPFDRAPHELSFGLFHSNASTKAAAEEVRAFSRRDPMINEVVRISQERFIDLSPDDYYDAPSWHLRRLFVKYCAALGEAAPFDQ